MIFYSDTHSHIRNHKSELRRQAKLEFIAANLRSHKKYKLKIDNSQSFKLAIYVTFFQILERIRWLIMFTVLHTVHKPLLNTFRT